MSYLRGRLRWGALGLAGFVAVAAPALAFAVGGLQSVMRLERGRWQIRNTETGSERSVCFGDPVVFVQLEHRGLACRREVLANDSNAGTVQYTCPSRGFGHTSIRVETTRLAQIDTQGLIDGRPFSYRAVARRIGAC